MLPPLTEPEKVAERRWQIGPYVIDIADDVDDTAAEAYKATFIAIHEGRQEWAQTFKKADYVWRIDGVDVHLKPYDENKKPLPDTEEEARRVLAEAQAPAS